MLIPPVLGWLFLGRCFRVSSFDARFEGRIVIDIGSCIGVDGSNKVHWWMNLNSRDLSCYDKKMTIYSLRFDEMVGT